MAKKSIFCNKTEENYTATALKCEYEGSANVVILPDQNNNVKCYDM